MLSVYIVTHENSIQFFLFLQPWNTFDTLCIWQHIDRRIQLIVRALGAEQIELNVTLGIIGKFHELLLFDQRT